MPQNTVAPEALTTASGAPVADNQNSVIADPRATGFCCKILGSSIRRVQVRQDAHEPLEAAPWNA
jgi:hypothetical protein